MHFLMCHLLCQKLDLNQMPGHSAERPVLFKWSLKSSQWPGATHFRGEFELPLRFCFVLLIRPCPGSDPLFLF